MHGLSLAPDITLFYQLALFFACYFVLRLLVFKPYLKLFEARWAKTQGLKEKAADYSERAEKYRQDYESFMMEEKKKVSRFMEEGRRQVAMEESALLSEAHKKVVAELDAVRAGIEAETAGAREKLLPLVPEFASAMSSKLLGKEVKVKSNNSRPPSGDQPSVSR